MAASKQYGTEDQYEKKLEKVMDVDRVGYKGNLYRFDHSVVKAKAKGIDLRYGSDAFAQLVLALEDLARMAERGIYD